MDTSPITARSLQKPYHVKGDEFERAYKDHLSDFRTWKHREHAQSWLVFPKNIGPNLSIDETALSNGDLYTIVSNKDAHGRKGTLVAIVSGTRVEDVVAALMNIHWYLRTKVREVTMDFSEGMHQIVLQCFPYADITLDRFHMQQLVSDAMLEFPCERLCHSCHSEHHGHGDGCTTHLLVERKRHLAAVSLFGRFINGKPHLSTNKVLLQAVFTVTAYGGSGRKNLAEPVLGCFTEVVIIPFRTFLS